MHSFLKFRFQQLMLLIHLYIIFGTLSKVSLVKSSSLRSVSSITLCDGITPVEQNVWPEFDIRSMLVNVTVDYSLDIKKSQPDTKSAVNPFQLIWSSSIPQQLCFSVLSWFPPILSLPQDVIQNSKKFETPSDLYEILFSMGKNFC